jgi:hypothetical protein
MHLAYSIAGANIATSNTAGAVAATLARDFVVMTGSLQFMKFVYFLLLVKIVRVTAHTFITLSADNPSPQSQLRASGTPFIARSA